MWSVSEGHMGYLNKAEEKYSTFEKALVMHARIYQVSEDLTSKLEFSENFWNILVFFEPQLEVSGLDHLNQT